MMRLALLLLAVVALASLCDCLCEVDPVAERTERRIQAHRWLEKTECVQWDRHDVCVCLTFDGFGNHATAFVAPPIVCYDENLTSQEHRAERPIDKQGEENGQE